ncbi:10240_t:CDS:1, partial [Scutellospora calospora]
KKIKLSKCKTRAIVRFYPQHNSENLYGLIIFTEIFPGNITQVDGMFLVRNGLDGLKTDEGEYIYTVKLYHEDKMMYDLTRPVINGAIEFNTRVPKTANLTICGEKSIIGNRVIINKGDTEIAKADIAALDEFN